MIPDWVSVIDLPPDVAGSADKALDTSLAGLHYAPLNICGQRKRVAMISDFFVRSFPMLFIVDVSAEVSMVARLCGVPYLVMRQHGQRDDLAHHLAFHNAYGLIAPYSPLLQASEEQWLSEKTFFTGGLCRFHPEEDESEFWDRKVGVLIGSGGTSIDLSFLNHIAEQCPSWNFEVFGKMNLNSLPASNLRFYGALPDPRAGLRKCSMVISNAGHNSVMEMAALNKRMILIPETRPFFEQQQKASLLEKLGFACLVNPADIYRIDWNALFISTSYHRPELGKLIEPRAAEYAAGYMKICYEKLFIES